MGCKDGNGSVAIGIDIVPLFISACRTTTCTSHGGFPVAVELGSEKSIPSNGGGLIPSNSGLAKPAQPDNNDSYEKSNIVLRSHSGTDPRMHVHVLERLVTTTDEVVENIPIFLELLDQPVKDLRVWPLNVENWKGLLHITLGLLRDHSTFSISAACTLARTMMICYNHQAPDKQLFLTLEHYLRSRDAGNHKLRLPRNVLFSSYVPYWLGYWSSDGLWRTIAFLEPSDAADAELLWMVNTFQIGRASCRERV